MEKMAKVYIPMPENCLKCDILKEWYGTDRETTFVRCHAGKCEMPMLPGYYKDSKLRPTYCPAIEEELQNEARRVCEPEGDLMDFKDINVTKSDIKDDSFVLIEASKLSLEDDFLQYEPQTEAQEGFKKNLTSAIKSGVKDFYRPIYDPSVDENGNIVFVAGKEPAVGHSYNWCVEAAKKYVSDRKIRLGTKNEYVAFLGVLIKKLIARGWSVADAWHAVCDDSKMLGHYWNSENAKHAFEYTGSREVCSFFDLANTFKILAWDDEAGGFWVASGNYDNLSYNNPLADLGLYYYQDYDYFGGVGWYVL